MVGNEDLLKSTLETAEDSEGAGTVQALKTMDSLETKIQQVQTAYQQFYTTLGVESGWKFVLDTITDFINRLNGMPKIFGKIPVAAINSIMPMIAVIKNLLTSLLSEIARRWQDISKAPAEAAQQASGQSEQAGKNLVQKFADGIRSMSGAVKSETQKILNEANLLTPEQQAAAQKTKKVQSASNFLNTSLEYRGGVAAGEEAYLMAAFNELKSVGLTGDLNPTLLTTEQLRQKLQEIINKYQELQGTSTQTGQALNSAGMKAATGWEQFRAKLQGLPSAIKSVWKETSTIRSGISMIGMALQGLTANIDQTTEAGANSAATLQGVSSILMAFAYGNPVLTAISSGIALVNMFASYAKNGSLDSQIERAEERAQELNDQATLLKSDFKTLDSGIKKYETLKEKRYESAEAAEEYQEQVDNLAETYPELIKGFDATGDAIIDASAAEIRLAELRKDSAEATAEAAAEEARLQELELKKKEKELKEKESEILSGSSPLTSFLYSVNNKETELLRENNPNYNANTGELFDENGNLIANIWGIKELVGRVQDETDDFSLFDFFDSLENVIPNETERNNILDAFMSYDIIGEYKEAYDEYLTQRESTQLSQQEEVAQEINRILREQDAYKDNSALATLYNYSVGKEYEREKENNSEIEDFQDFKSDSSVLSDFENLEEWYDNLSDTKKELFEEMFGNLETYSAEAIIQELGLEGTGVDILMNEYLADTVQNNQNRIVGAVAQAAGDTIDGWTGELKESSFFEGKDILSLGNMDDTLKQFYRNFVLNDSLTENETDAAVAALEQYTSLVDRGFTGLANNYLTQWQTLYNYITNNVSDAAQRDILLSQLKDYDLTSVAGIVAAKKAIEDNDELDESQKSEITDAMDSLINSVVTNIALEIKAIQDTLVEEIESIEEDIGDISKEMDYTDAFKLYEKMLSSVENPEDYSFNKVFKQSEEDPTKYYLDNYELSQKYDAQRISDIESQNEELRKLINDNSEGVKEIFFATNEKATLDIIKGDFDSYGLNEELWSSISKLGLENSFVEYVKGNIDYEDWVKLVDNAILYQNVLIDNLTEGINSLKEFKPIQDLISANKFEEAKSLDGADKFASNIERASTDAYAELLEDYLSSTAEEFERNSYQYTNDLAEGFDDLSSGNVNEKLLRNYAEKAGYNLQQTNEAIAEWYDKNASQSLTKPAMIAAFKDVIADPGAITNDVMAALATSLNADIEVLKTWFYHNDDDTYSTSLETISSMAETFGVEATTAIQDALLEYFSAIKDTISNSFEGKMSYAEFDVLNDFFGRTLNLDYTKTADGLKLTKQSLVEIYNEVKKIDGIQAESVLNTIAASWENTEEGYQDVSSIMGRIQEINNELANPKVSDARRKELEKELVVAKDILKIRSSDPDSFSFMDNDIPDGMKAPENYWNSIGDAYAAMNEATSSGYMEIQDFYNIVNQMNAMMTAAGQEFNIGGMNAAELIEAGMSALSNIDGEGVKVSLDKLGIDFLDGADGMKANFGDAMKVMAEGQIEMLDAAIQMLEAIVAMEQLGDLDVNGNHSLDLEEIFKLDTDGNPTAFADGYAETMVEVRNALVKAGIDLNKTTIGAHTLNDLLTTSFTEWKGLGISVEEQQRLMDALYQAVLNGDYDPNNLSSLFQVLSSSLTEDMTVDLGNQIVHLNTNGDYITVDFDSEKNKELLKGKSEKEIESIKEDLVSYFNGGTISEDSLELILQLTGQLNWDEENQVWKTSDGKTFNSVEEANTHLVKKQFKDNTGAKGVEMQEDGSIKGTVTCRDGAEINVELGEDGYVYTSSKYPGISASSLPELTRKIFNATGGESSWGSEENFTSKTGLTLEPEIEVTPIFKSGDLGDENGITEEVIEEYGLDTTQINNIAAAIAAADWGPVGEAVGEGIKKAFEPAENETENNIGELTISPTAITIDTSNATTTVGEIEVTDITITIPEGLSNEAIGLINNYNDAVAEAAANGVVSTGIEANTIPATTLLSILTLRQALLDLKSNNEVNASVNVAAVEENTLSLIENILAVYGVSGQTAELFFNATDNEGNIQTIADNINNVNDKSITITIEATEAQNTIEELTKDDTKKITITYDSPETVGPQSTGTPGYSVSGVDNASGNRVEVGHYDTIEQTAKAVEASVENGTFQNGTFEITEITADGTQTTITATLAEIQAGNISFTGNDGNGSNNGNSNDNNSETLSTVPIDFSGLTSSLTELNDAATATAGNISNAGSALSNLDSSPINTATGRIMALANAAKKIPSGAGKINALSTAIKSIPSKKDISINYKITVSTSGGGATGAISSVTGNVSSWGKNSASGSIAFAKGNRTLMGELGPELVVSNGHYFTVGENGAEFVDLADDAIVFNHLQTKKLLSSGSSGRGTPVTNEKKATSLATGNAMASAATVLAELKQIRAMWQALLDASAKDLGSKAGSGGGGGGGGGNNDNSGYEYDLERWYNLLRQIEKLEQQITYEQAKRENMRSGYKYVDSLEKELELLEKQLKAEKELASLQYDYYLKRMEDVNNSNYSKIFTYDEQGLMQYVDGKDHGLDALATLQATDEYGVLKMSAKEQLAYITGTLGISLSDLKYKSDGSEAEEDKDKVEVFFDNVDSLMDELDELYDSYHEHAEKLEDLTSSQNEILQEYIDNQISLEGKLLQAIEDREQAEIDRLTDEKEALEEATQDYIDGLSEALSKEQDLYNNNQTDEETAKLQRRLAILQRSGGSASEIKSLQDQIDSRLQDAYFQAQQDQIDAIQEASQNQLEKLQTQIDLMTEALEYQKENGLLWNEVYEMMNNWTPEKMLQFIEEYTKSYKENSKTQNDEDSKETLKEAEIWAAKRDKDARDNAWNDYYANANYDESIKEANKTAAQEAFNTGFASGGSSAGEAAANKIFDDATAALKKNENNSTTAPTEEVSTASQSATVQGGQMNVRDKASSKGKKLGIVKSGKGFKAVGYSNGWLKVEEANTTKGTKSGYMKYKGYEKYYKGLNISNLPAYAQGGLVDFTGPAWVDGSKSKPEAFLSASDTALLKSSIFSDGDNSLKVLVAAIEEITGKSSSYSPAESSGIVIENATVNIQPGTISNDYDARRAGEMALEEMVKIARKTTNKVVSRR